MINFNHKILVKICLNLFNGSLVYTWKIAAMLSPKAIIIITNADATNNNRTIIKKI